GRAWRSHKPGAARLAHDRAARTTIRIGRAEGCANAAQPSVALGWLAAGDDHGAEHPRAGGAVRNAEVAEGAGVVEGERERVTLPEQPRVDGPIVPGHGVLDGVVVRRGNRGAR